MLKNNYNQEQKQSTKQQGNDLATQLMAEIKQDEANFIKDGYNEFKHLDENENVTQEFKQLQDQNIVERSGSTFFLTENIYHQITNIFKVETQYEIQVHSPEVVKSKLGLKKHVEFTVQLANLKENKVWTVKRRYKSFKFLETILKNDWPGIYIPPLPERAMDNITADNLLNTTYSGLSGSYSLQKIDERCRHFEYFLIKIMDNRLLAESQVVQTFLTMPNLKHLLKYLKNYKMMDMKQIVDKYTSIFSIFRTLPMTEEIKTKYVAFSKWTRRVKLRLMKMNQIAKRLKQNFNEGYNALNNFKDKFLIGYMEKFLEYDDASQMYPALKDDFKPEVFDEICDLMQNELYDVLSLENAFDDINN
ncbi:Phox homologous domain [Pseudocohnilembus persalinus]|uniref:Phox homologous domain n=1 Tax=Pseudocohnilembus persalinus TaxID=266149 RepID=A0A0V0QI61_PSEPJ|nr:Phox homologous domain [Pseudocohnilembus persalinus]|eukprot:KRX01890.1 Phox homologous domain [Pseudocohnilembus persalinus]